MLLRSPWGVVVFGAGTFILHKLDMGTAAITAEGVGERTVVIEGYILPAGEDISARAAAMESARRLLCRTVGASDGFDLETGGKRLHLIPRESPAFTAEAPFTGTDAAHFLLTARTAEDGAFRGGDVSVTGRALEGSLIFPLGISEETLLATMSGDGTVTVVNGGDLPCGFAARITAEGGPLESLSLSLDGDTVTVTHRLEDGGEIVLDTRPARKGVWADGASVMEDVAWDSVFFSLKPGENRIGWRSEGFGHAVMRLAFQPRYL